MGLIVETDLGRDPDDLFTLIWLIENNIKIKAITITPGDHDQIAIAKFLNTYYSLSIPIGAPTLTRDKKSSGGVHYKLLKQYRTSLEEKPDGIGADIIESVYDSAEDDILIIGPCTNIGRWIEAYKPIIKKATMQGGFLPCEMEKFKGMQFCPTFNLNGDRRAANIFLNYDIPNRSMVGKNVCHGIEMTDNGFRGGLNRELANWYLQGHSSKKMHDPVAMMCHLYPNIGEWVKGKTVKMGAGWTTDTSGQDNILEYLFELEFWYILNNGLKRTIMRNRATELEYLKWFRINADFGPAESDIIDWMNRRFMEDTGRNLPEGWNYAEDGETSLDE